MNGAGFTRVANPLAIMAVVRCVADADATASGTHPAAAATH